MSRPSNVSDVSVSSTTPLNGGPNGYHRRAIHFSGHVETHEMSEQEFEETEDVAPPQPSAVDLGYVGVLTALIGLGVAVWTLVAHLEIPETSGGTNVVIVPLFLALVVAVASIIGVARKQLGDNVNTVVFVSLILIALFGTVRLLAFGASGAGHGTDDNSADAIDALGMAGVSLMATATFYVTNHSRSLSRPIDRAVA
ncbi:hypothetical protein BJ742DRAFT_117747 [Cladochytrium replicatum]|nr:hypothetical protein BJ742DRAFT_117747 [Cladochytrium replicatum]